MNNKIIFFLLLFFLSAFGAQAQWQKIKSLYGSSYLSSFAESGNKIYACIDGYIYYSGDYGKSWTVLGNLGEKNDYDITKGIIIQDNVIYTYSDTNIRCTDDNGITWHNNCISRPINPNTVVGGVKTPTPEHVSSLGFYGKDSLIFCGRLGDLYISPDKGNTWKHIIDFPEPQYGMTDVICCVPRGNTIYAGVIEGVTVNHSTTVTDFPYMMISKDRGVSWDSLSCEGMPVGTEIKDIAFLGDTVFAYTTNGLYRSIDTLHSWEPIYYCDNYPAVSNIKIQGDTILVASSNSGVNMSTDGGETWREYTENLPAKDICDFIIHGSYGIVSARYRGIYITTDGGQSWQYIPTGSNLDVWDIAKCGNKMFVPFWEYASIYHSGLGMAISADNCENWTTYNPEIPVHDPIRSINEKDSVIIGSFYEGQNNAFVSLDAGSSWFVSSLPALNDVYFSDSIIVAGTNKCIYISRDTCHTWTASTDSIGKKIVIDGFAKAGNVLYGRSIYNGIYSSNDDGLSWHFSYADGAVPFYSMCSSGKAVYVASDTAIYKTTDGVNWTRFTLHHKYGYVSGIFHIAYSGNNFFAAGDGGIFLSQDDGNTWACITNGVDELSTASINSLKVIDNYLYVCTMMHGLYRINLNDVSSVHSEGHDMYFYNFQPYPNPAQSYVTSHIYWDSGTDIDEHSFAVYDASGKAVGDYSRVHLDRTEGTSGYISWDCSGVAPGIYIITLMQNGQMRSIKVAVNR